MPFFSLLGVKTRKKRFVHQGAVDPVSMVAGRWIPLTIILRAGATLQPTFKAHPTSAVSVKSANLSGIFATAYETSKLKAINRT
ncbi:uncharacterized protein DFL_000491 [Arthrobotrys flagrans]|uniref:Uncharacterized protein n=1 Tax=Arthrobotrys flagrans TaxID=97331 RepID=A0A437AEE4_ARTFL|nr:hypothetical protein DFL_000491 [Arthrobotrys flagrans]